MKHNVLSVTVATALGVGVVGYPQAQQADEGCKAYVTGSVVNLRLVNPVTNNLVQPADPNDPGSVAWGSGLVSGRVNNGAGDVPATTGFWNSAPPPGVFDAPQSCINGNEVEGGPPCPGENDFAQVDRFQDFGRSDLLVVPAENPQPGQPDGTGDGDDFEFLAACQRTIPDLGVFAGAAANTTSQSLGQVFTLSANDPVPAPLDPQYETLEWRATYEGVAETAIIGTSAGFAQANNSVNFSIRRVADDVTINCDSSAIEVSAGPGSDEDPFSETAVECKAADFPSGSQVFRPGVEYELTINFSDDASCSCLQGPPPDGFKWYFAKQTTRPRLPNPIVNDLVINDQFGSRTVDVRLLIGLMNPAVKNEDGPPEGTDHLTCYNLRRTSENVIVPGGVRITTDNFGVEDVRLTRGPKELCGPALKNGVGDLGGPYYTCYVANGGQNQGAITVTDQFFTERPHQLTSMSRVCTPAGLNGAPPPVLPLPDHLACYEFASQPRLPRQPPFLPTVDDPFISGTGLFPPEGAEITVEREQRWCEPATKELLP